MAVGGWPLQQDGSYMPPEPRSPMSSVLSRTDVPVARTVITDSKVLPVVSHKAVAEVSKIGNL